jgi:site-specific recombinase XerD
MIDVTVIPPPAPLAELVSQAHVYADASMAANTRRAYAADWRDFEGWCASHGARPLPAHPDALALYLTERAGLLSVATLARRLAAIRAAHTVADLALPSSPSLTRIWAGIRRTHGRPARGKAALVIEDLRRVLEAMPPDTLRGRRDRTLLLVGFGAALRRSELASLSLDATAHARAVFVPAGLEIHLDRAKADQEGDGAVVAIPLGSRPETCAATALRAWLDKSGIKAGAIFRRIDRGSRLGKDAITPQTVAAIVKTAARRVGLDANALAGHSLRAGLATSAADAETTPAVLMAHMRHARFETTQRYIRAADRFRKNAASLAGL